jgi:hypothetical protein
MKLLLWLILLFFCAPLAIFILILYPILWILLLPFRILGIAVDGVFDLLGALLKLPARIIKSI